MFTLFSSLFSLIGSSDFFCSFFSTFFYICFLLFFIFYCQNFGALYMFLLLLYVSRLLGRPCFIQCFHVCITSLQQFFRNFFCWLKVCSSQLCVAFCLQTWWCSVNTFFSDASCCADVVSISNFVHAPSQQTLWSTVFVCALSSFSMPIPLFLCAWLIYISFLKKRLFLFLVDHLLKLFQFNFTFPTFCSRSFFRISTCDNTREYYNVHQIFWNFLEF